MTLSTSQRRRRKLRRIKYREQSRESAQRRKQWRSPSPRRSVG